MHTHIRNTYAHTFQAIKDIAAGQEILVWYGSAGWFQSKDIPYVDVDYAKTMWRPGLHPLPCRQRVRKTKGADGRPWFYVGENLPSGTLLDISLCVNVSVIVVDQFPVLWDFVLMDATTQTVCAHENVEGCWSLTILIRTNIYLC